MAGSLPELKLKVLGVTILQGRDRISHFPIDFCMGLTTVQRYSTSTVIRTFIEEFVSSKEAPPWSSVVGLEDEFQTLMNRQDRFRKFISAQSSYKVHGVVHIDCKHVHVIKQTPTNNHSKSHYITYQQSLQVTLHHLPTSTPSHTTSPTNNHSKSHYITYQQPHYIVLSFSLDAVLHCTRI